MGVALSSQRRSAPLRAEPLRVSGLRRAAANARELPRPGKAPCGTCPYRRDVPAGIWHPAEYARLPGYDGETFEQTALALFFCHQQDGHLCAGWVGCHDTRGLLAMRFNPVAPETFDYASPVPLFASGAEAAAHGLSGVQSPGQRARQAIAKLTARRAASVDTHPKDGDALAAPLVSGAVLSEAKETPK